MTLARSATLLFLLGWVLSGAATRAETEFRTGSKPGSKAGAKAEPEAAGWPSYGGDPGGSRHSPLMQITRENVAQLEVAWTHRTGDYPGGREGIKKAAFQATPILDAGTLYFCSPVSRAFAIEAETGEQRWVFDAGTPLQVSPWSSTCRGVALWRDRDAPANAACSRRVFMGTMDAKLVAIDASTGKACTDFGDGGRIDLHAGLGEVEDAETYMTSPPVVIDDLVVNGALVADNRRANPPGGVIRAWDARTGALRWAFDPVPPGTPPLPPGPDGSPRFHRGTPNAWSILSVDPARHLIFVPFGNNSPDYFGGHRKGFDHYGSAVVALRARDGMPAWRFQTVHHDLWDYDVASQPTLIDVVKDGRTIAAVAQATKMGHLFLLDRDTGEPLYPVEERPVPQTDIPGEFTSPTQPFPTFPPPLHPGRLTEEDAWGFTPWDRGKCVEKMRRLRNEGIFTPPSFQGSIQYPGTAGGSNWGSVAFDPKRRLLVMNQNRVAQVHTLIPREDLPEAEKDRERFSVSLQRGTPYLIKHEIFDSPFGLPCNPPPWGTLFALDLETGEKRWEIPFGTVRDMAPVPIPWNLGMPSMGGPIVTASGLVFIAASMDDYLRAYDIETGEELWSARLPAGGQATPMTYRLGPQGKQYVVIAAGGHSTLGTRSGDYVIAYALP